MSVTSWGRVLAAVDFGEPSASAVALAGAVAQAFGATLTVLYAETMEMPPYFTRAQVDALEAERQEARAAAADYVRMFAARHASVTVEPLVVDGPAVNAILSAARTFDLIVLGTHGRRGPRRWWLGSVAESVVREASTPVLVTCALEAAALERFREWAAGVAGARHDLAAANWIAELGQVIQVVVTRPSEPASFVQALTSCSFPVLLVPDTLPTLERRSP